MPTDYFERVAAAPACDLGSDDSDLRRISSTASVDPVTARRWLLPTKTPPDNIRIWIGNFDRRNWKADWAHNSLRISRERGRYPWTVNPDGTPRPNTQTTTYVAGKLYIHAFTCPFPEILNSTKLTGPVDRALVQIWPIRHSFIAWRLPVLTDMAGRCVGGTRLPLTGCDRQGVRCLTFMVCSLKPSTSSVPNPERTVQVSGPHSEMIA